MANVPNGGTLTTVPTSKKTYSETNIKQAIRSTGLYSRNEIEWYTKVSRVPIIDPYNALTSSKEYMFITRPDLNIFDGGNTSVLNSSLKNVPIFYDAIKDSRYNNVLQELQWSSNASKASDVRGPFNYLLTNSCKSSVDLPGISADDMETAGNMWGTKMYYRKSSITSDNNHEFTLEFEDTKYTEVYMWFKLFDEYERLKYEGSVAPRDVYIKNRISHDKMAIYKFIVGEDMETIIYFAKLYGVYPKTVPRDSFSDMSSSGGIKFSVTFKCDFVEDMDPAILYDFNDAIKSRYTAVSKDITKNSITGSKDKSWWNFTTDSYNARWCNIPYIAQRVSKDKSISQIDQFLLKWR